MPYNITKTLGRVLCLGFAAAMLANASAVQASMIQFDLDEFTGTDATLHITLDDDDNAGKITVYADVVEPPIGDIRGIFFNVNDVPGLTIGDIGGPGYITDIQADTSNLGNGANVNPEGPFDFGVEFGDSGIGSGKGDFQSVWFLIDDLGGALALADFGTFAGRLTSVGLAGSSRNGSSKLIGDPGPIPVTPVTTPPILWLFVIAVGVAASASIRRRRTVPATT